MVFQAPHRIDVTATEAVPTPKQWSAALPEQDEVQVLRLCDAIPRGISGWCAVAGELQGPEIEVMCGGINTKQPTYGGVWRQGHLMHFGFQPAPGEYNESGRKLLLNCIAYIARFGQDRPIVRERSFVDPDGGGAPSWRLDYLLGAERIGAAGLARAFSPPWSERIAALADDEARAFVRQRLPALGGDGAKYTFHEDALALGVDVRRDGVLPRLAAMLEDDERSASARRLLLALLPDGPDAGTTATNWGFWFQARGHALCYDPHSHVWRLDPVAMARGEASGNLRGAGRASGDQSRDADAAALAARVVAHHGGARALDDLRAFTCSRSGVQYLWNRAEGYFRMERQGQPAGRTTPWKVAVFDTAANDDLIHGGGPAPRPLVSAKGAFRELVERLFLPLLLSDPSTSVRLLPVDGDEDGLRRLEVRLGARCLDPRKVHVLHVDPSSGEVKRVDVARNVGARVATWHVDASAQVGPLTLPTGWYREGRRLVYGHAKWNPEVPADATTATEQILVQ